MQCVFTTALCKVARQSYWRGCYRRRERVVVRCCQCCSSNPRHSKPRQHTTHLHKTGKRATHHGNPLIHGRQHSTVHAEETSRQARGNVKQNSAAPHSDTLVHITHRQIQRTHRHAYKHDSKSAKYTTPPPDTLHDGDKPTFPPSHHNTETTASTSFPLAINKRHRTIATR